MVVAADGGSAEASAKTSELLFGGRQRRAEAEQSQLPRSLKGESTLTC